MNPLLKQKLGRAAGLLAVSALTAVLTYGVIQALPVPHRTDGLPQVKDVAVPPQSLHRVLHALRDRTLTKPGLTYGSGTASRIRITNETDFTIGGVIYRKAATDNIASSVSTGTALTSTQAAIFRVEIDDTGAVSTVQGPIVTLASEDPPIPGRSACARASSPMIGLVCKATLGWFHVTGIAFTPGTTSLNNAGITFFDGDPDLTESLLAVPVP